jgi:hypothetical protein
VTADEERPRPQYGEYATPEEVAEARGPLPVQPTDPVSRLAAPISRSLSTRAAKSNSRPAPGLSSAPPPRGAPVAARHPRQANNMITVLLLVVGVWNTVTSIPSYLDLGPVLSQGLQLAGYPTVAFGAAAHTAGIVLLVLSLLVLIAAVGVSFRLIRGARRSIWVPVVAGALYLVAAIVVMTVVVANTPALAAVLHNH